MSWIFATISLVISCYTFYLLHFRKRFYVVPQVFSRSAIGEITLYLTNGSNAQLLVSEIRAYTVLANSNMRDIDNSALNIGRMPLILGQKCSSVMTIKFDPVSLRDVESNYRKLNKNETATGEIQFQVPVGVHISWVDGDGKPYSCRIQVYDFHLDKDEDSGIWEIQGAGASSIPKELYAQLEGPQVKRLTKSLRKNWNKMKKSLRNRIDLFFGKN